MFVYSAISWEEIRSLPIFRACVRTWRYLLRRAATPTVSRSAIRPFSSRLVTKRHDSASGPDQAAGGTVSPARPSSGRTSDQSFAERVRIDEVRERAPAVDLDDRDQLAVPELELVVAVDPDDLELERELSPHLLHHLEHPLAERAAFGDIDGDAPRDRDPAW